MIKKKISIIPLLLWILFLFLMRWNTFSMPFERDEGEYAYSALMLSNGLPPYKNSFIQKPPIIIYLYYVGQLISPSSLILPRIMALVSLAAASIFIALTAGKIINSKVIYGLLYLFPVLVMLPQHTPYAANTEIFLITPMAIALYIYSLGVKKNYLWVLLGIISALGIYIKPISVPFFTVLLILSFYRKYRERDLISNKLSKKSKDREKVSAFNRIFEIYPIKEILNNLGFYLIGILIISIITFLPIILLNDFADFWQAVVDFNKYYAALWGYGFNALFFRFGQIKNNIWLLIPLILYFFYAGKKYRIDLILLFLSVFGLVYTSWLGHYYILLMPVIGLMVMFSLFNLSNLKIFGSGKNLSFWIMTGILIITLLYPTRSQFVKSSQELVSWVYGRNNPFIEAVEAGKIINNMTDANDFIYIYGSEPEIYYYALRKPPTRFINLFPIILKTPLRHDFETEVIDALNKFPPKVIILTKNFTGSSGVDEIPARLAKHISQTISRDYQFKTGYFLDYHKGYWLENMTPEELRNASILIYLANSK